MSDMLSLATSKAEAFTRAVTTDVRWQVEDELMCQVFGFTMYGYVFGVGRLACFMDVEEIRSLVEDQLTGLGVGPRYAEGMVQQAHEEMFRQGDPSLHSKLVEIGHSHFGSADIDELVESVYVNTERIRRANGQR